MVFVLVGGCGFGVFLALISGSFWDDKGVEAGQSISWHVMAFGAMWLVATLVCSWKDGAIVDQGSQSAYKVTEVELSSFHGKIAGE